MKLRTKLFLSIGILFFLFAVAALFLEDYIVDSQISKTEQSFTKRIYEHTKKNREKLETYLAETIAGYEGQVDSFLRHHRDLSKEQGSYWSSLTASVADNDWIDFLSISDKRKEYALIPARATLYPFTYYKSDMTIHVKEKKADYLVQEISLGEEEKKFFPTEKLLLLRRKKSFPPKGHRGEPYSLSYQKSDPSFSSRGNGLKQAYIEEYEKNNTRKDIARLGSILSHRETYQEIPIGIALIYNEKEGGVLFSDELFFLGTSRTSHLPATKYLIFSSSDSHDFFLGAEEEVPLGTLRVGRVISEMVKDLSLITGDLVVALHDRHYLAAKGGERITLTLPTFPKEEIGEVNIGGETLFYAKIVPFKNSDLTFVLLQKKSAAFAMIDFVKSSLHSVITKVSWNMRIMGLVALAISLFFLQRIASAISRPITMLAHATKEVVNGHYEKAKLPKKSSNDEVGFLVGSFSEMVDGLKEREKVQGALNKVVSKEIANKLLKGEIHLGGEEREGVLLFADIRDFTHHTEKMPPQEVISLLNQCMTKVSHVIDLHHGVIDKYVGDEVMALFNIPVASDDSTLQAVQCAVEMQKAIDAWNKERESKGLFPVQIGIGLHKGKVVAGNMGSENRLNYTVVGANVNLASRLCSRAKGGEILLSHAVVDDKSVSGKYGFLELDPLSLKGFSEKIPVFSLKQ